MAALTYFLCGIGGSGMTPLAYLLKENGHTVLGSDRSYDQGKLKDKFQRFIDSGINIVPQDGSAITNDIDYLVVSSAVEDRISDVKRAKELSIPIVKRAQLLAELFNDQKGIAIAGTSGKTTVTAMIGHVLNVLDMKPTIVNGGAMLNFMQGAVPQAYHVGDSDLFVAETDESDGSILYFNPLIGVLNNVADDHKPMAELMDIFTQYIKNCQKAVVINKDNDFCNQLLDSNIEQQFITFSAKDEAADIFVEEVTYCPDGAQAIIKVQGKSYDLNMSVPGLHNIYNAAACLGVVGALKADIKQAIEALSSFKGTKRRLEIVGQVNDITIYDDFAHNPDKIAASLSTLQEFDGRLIVMYQPHGFGPTRMLKDQLIESFSSGLKDQDLFMMPEIYYAGGTVEKNISSLDIINGVNDNKKKAHFFETRQQCGEFIKKNAEPGDRIVIMGARDDTLTIFAHEILDALKR